MHHTHSMGNVRPGVDTSLCISFRTLAPHYFLENFGAFFLVGVVRDPDNVENHARKL